jgi:6-phosphogluconolactonase (cycloisomerase 2 family)
MNTKCKAFFILLLLAAELFSACGIIPYPSPPPPPPPPHFELLYATGFRQVLGLQLNAATGALSTATTTPGPNTGLGTTATMVADPAGKFLFVYDTEGEAIDVFAINSTTSALTAISKSPFPAAGIGAPGGMAIDTSGKFLCVAGVSAIDVFAINGTSGALTLEPGSPFPDNNGPFGVVAAPSSKFIYVSGIGQGQAAMISGFSVNSTSGALTPVPGSPFSTLANGSPFYLAARSSGQFLYAGIPSTNSVMAWSIDGATGSLTLLPGFPLALSPNNLASISSIVADPSEKFLYVSDDFGDVFGFTANASSGALTAMPGSPFFFFTTGQLFVDPSGRFLYSPAGPFISGFSIDATTGVPTPLSGSPFPAGAGLVIPATLTFAKGSS